MPAPTPFCSSAQRADPQAGSLSPPAVSRSQAEKWQLPGREQLLGPESRSDVQAE